MPISVPATPPCSAHRLLSRGRSSNLRPFALPRPDSLSPLPYRPYAVWHLVYVDTSMASGTRACEFALAGRPGPIGAGLCSLLERRELPIYGVLRSSLREELVLHHRLGWPSGGYRACVSSPALGAPSGRHAGRRFRSSS